MAKNPLINALNAPYSAVRARVFGLIYPAAQIFTPSELEKQGYSDDTVAYDENKVTITPLKSDLVADTANPYKIKDASIDACMIAPIGVNKYDPNKQYIIHCDGNASCYQAVLPTLKSLCEATKANIVAFNPPGVGFSTGVTTGPEVYMDTLKIMIEHLHKQGIPYANIVLSGRSFGAAISTMVALDYQRQNVPIKVFNDRSFANMADIVGTTVKNIFKNPILNATVGTLADYGINGLIRMLGLNFDPAKAFIEINTINPKHAVCTVVEGDKVIPEAASLYANIPEAMRKENGVKLTAHQDDDPHNISLDMLNVSGTEQSAIKYQLSSLNKFKTNKNNVIENKNQQLKFTGTSNLHHDPNLTAIVPSQMPDEVPHNSKDKPRKGRGPRTH